MPSVLIIENDALMLEAIVGYVSQAYNDALVIGSTEGEEAIELLQGNDFDVVIADQWLDGVSGIQVLYFARMHQPAARRILMSASLDPTSLVHGINFAGIQYVLPKPFGPEALAEALALLTH